MTFQEQQRELVNAIIADLCNISEYPDGLFPHTVFVEEVSEDTGEPVYNHYKLVSINQSNATCVLENPTTQEQDEFDLKAIATDWLITVVGWCRYLMAEQDMWREHAIECLENNTDAPLDEILGFVNGGWQNLLSDAKNISSFFEELAEITEREQEYPLRRLLDVALLEINGFEESLTYQICVEALERIEKDNSENESTPALAEEKELWAYLYPIDDFTRNASDEEIISAYESESNDDRNNPIERMTPDELTACVNDNELADQVFWVRFIETI